MGIGVMIRAMFPLGWNHLDSGTWVGRVGS
jgi:hypothetical protein